ncbi:MAG: hypothetical protein N2Z72_06305 [Bacteroidales bacterium]|nr:hypothetical protein [Bacteroidales bacterium]
MEKRISKTLISIFVIQWFFFIGWIVFESFRYDLSRDDFWYLTFTRSGNLFQDLNTWFHHSNGRFTTAVLQTILFYLPTSWIYPTIVGGFLLLLFFISYLVLPKLTSVFSVRILLSCLFFEMIILSLPAKADTLFWPSGILSHSIGLAMMLPILYHMENKQYHVGLTSVFSFFIAGIGETAGLIFFMLLLSWFLNHKKPQYFIPILFFVIGWIVHFFIPASLSRLQLLHEQSHIDYFHAFLATSWQNIMLLPQTLLISALWGIIKYIFDLPLTEKRNKGIFQSLLIYWLIYLLFITFVMKDAEPPRAALFIHFMTWIMLSSVLQRWLIHLKDKKKLFS